MNQNNYKNIKTKQLDLKKHVNTIHCSNNLTLVQRKLFNALLFNAYPELPYKTTFQIHTRQLCELIGYNSNDYGKLKKALLGLITIAIEWNVIDASTEKETNWKASSILSSAELEGGYCSYEYSQVMKNLLYQPDIYGRINMGLVAQFKSCYGLALYENCIRYQGLPQTPWFSLEVFRKLMGVFGEKYTAFKDFKKRVINVAINEVNMISPIHVYTEIERNNQKAVRIRFKLTKNLPQNPNSSDLDLTINPLTEILSSTFGFSDKIIQKVLNNYEPKYINEKIEMIIQSDSFLSGKIKGLAGYLTEALRQDYKNNNSSKKLLDDARKQRENLEKKYEEQKLKKQDRYNRYINNKIDSYLEELSEIEHAELIKEFEKSIKQQNEIFRGWYRKNGFEHPAIQAAFRSYIKENSKYNLGQTLSLEEFSKIFERYD